MPVIHPIRAVALGAMLAFSLHTESAKGEDAVAGPFSPQFEFRLAQLPDEAPAQLPPAGRVLTLSEVEALVVAHHPALRAAEGQTRAARGRWVQVGLRPNPEIGYMGDEIGDGGMAGMHGGFVSQEFVTAGKLGLSRAAASGEVAAAEQRLARARLQIVSIARSYYFQLLAAQREVTLSRELGTMTSRAVRASEMRLQADDISRAALLQTQIENDWVSLIEQEAVNRYEAAQRQLAIAIGLDTRTETMPSLEDSFQQPLPSLDWESTRARILAESPELAEAQSMVERARWAVERATAGRVPNVTLMGSVQYNTASQDTMANVQIGMPLPVFDRNQGEIAAAYGELTAAQAALDQTQWVLEQRLAAALRDYLTARQRVNKYVDTILPATRQSLDMFTQAYQQGELDYLQLISAQKSYTEKNLAYLQDLETAWQKWAEIDGLLVDKLSDGSN